MSDLTNRLRAVSGGNIVLAGTLLHEAADEIERLRVTNKMLMDDKAALQARVTELDADARRYQWIRSRCRSEAFDADVEWEWYEQDPDTLDAAIDAALKGSSHA